MTCRLTKRQEANQKGTFGPLKKKGILKPPENWLEKHNKTNPNSALHNLFRKISSFDYGRRKEGEHR